MIASLFEKYFQVVFEVSCFQSVEYFPMRRNVASPPSKKAEEKSESNKFSRKVPLVGKTSTQKFSTSKHQNNWYLSPTFLSVSYPPSTALSLRIVKLSQPEKFHEQRKYKRKSVSMYVNNKIQ